MKPNKQRHGRVALRGKPLKPECYKARVMHNDFQTDKGFYDTCWGLIDPMTEDDWPECQTCKAHAPNMPLLTKDIIEWVGRDI